MKNVDDITKVRINVGNDIVSPYAEDGNEVVNSEFANFLDNAIKDVPARHNLSIEITSIDCDIARVSKAIKNYYSNELQDTMLKLKRNLIFSIITLLIGLSFLAINMLFKAPILIASVLDIFAWVFVWEAVDLFFFRRPDLRYQYYKQKKCVDAKIIITLKDN